MREKECKMCLYSWEIQESRSFSVIQRLKPLPTDVALRSYKFVSFLTFTGKGKGGCRSLVQSLFYSFSSLLLITYDKDCVVPGANLN